MSQWQPYEIKDTFYFLVDSKPDEIVDTEKPDIMFCTAFVSTASCINGVKQSDLPWFRQYKECSTLDESKTVLKNLIDLVMNENFQNLYVWVLSSKFSSINRNGLEFLHGAEREVGGLTIREDYVLYNGGRYNINKAKMLIWYNFCLCNMATILVDNALHWKQKRGEFLIDRLADSDSRILKFMQMIMRETSLRKLWIRCAEDHNIKPDYIGFGFPSHKDINGRITPAINSMQASLVDWIVYAAYAYMNGIENRDPEFQAMLVNFIDILIRNKSLQMIPLDEHIKWE